MPITVMTNGKGTALFWLGQGDDLTQCWVGPDPCGRVVLNMDPDDEVGKEAEVMFLRQYGWKESTV